MNVDQDLINAATVIARVARRANRHPKTADVMLSMADHLRREAMALREPGVLAHDGYTLTVCRCDGGPYLGARKAGTPCCCERCGFITEEQRAAIVEGNDRMHRALQQAKDRAISRGERRFANVRALLKANGTLDSNQGVSLSAYGVGYDAAMRHVREAIEADA